MIGTGIRRGDGKEAMIMIVIGTAIGIMSGREVAVGSTDVNHGENDYV